MPADDGSCRSRAIAIRITGNPVNRVTRRAPCHLVKIAANYPPAPRMASKICGGRCSPVWRRAQSHPRGPPRAPSPILECPARWIVGEQLVTSPNKGLNQPRTKSGATN